MSSAALESSGYRVTAALPMTATAYENSAFVWIRLVKVNSSLTWDTQNCFHT